MSATTENPEVLNKLLEDILVGVLNQGQGKLESRTGKTIKISRLQQMKLDMAKRLVQISLKQLSRFGDPSARFNMIVGLMNEHLPKAVEAIGEEAVLAKIEGLPEETRDGDVIRLLERAGAKELAKLLRKASGELEEEAAVAEAAAAGPAAEAESVADEAAAAGEAGVSGQFVQAAEDGAETGIGNKVSSGISLDRASFIRLLDIFEQQVQNLESRNERSLSEMKASIAQLREQLGTPREKIGFTPQ